MTVTETVGDPVGIVAEVAELVTRVVRDFKRELFVPGTIHENVEVEFGARIALELHARDLLAPERVENVTQPNTEDPTDGA